MLSLSCLVICSCRDKRAETASAQDFQGRWKGTWSWDASRSSMLEISNDVFKVSSLPLTDEMDAEIVTQEGTAQFDQAYGASSKPCVLLVLSNRIVPFFIYKDKRHMLYQFGVGADRSIVFVKE
jgi:hypothetical protein